MTATSPRCPLVLLIWLAAVPALRCAGQTTAPEYFQSALAKSKKGDNDGAIADYTKSIELDPAHASTYNNRGVLRKAKGDYHGALADYNKAIELDPKYSYPYNGRANIERERGNLETALSDYNMAIALDPKSMFPYHGRGHVKRDKGDIDGAMADYALAIAADPSAPLPHLARAYVLRHRGDFDEAIAECDTAIRLNPKDNKSYYHRALARRLKGDLDGAIADCSTSIQLSSRYCPPFKLRGSLHLRNRAWNDGLSDFRRVMKFSVVWAPEYIQFWIWYARVHLGEKAQADEELASYMALKSNAGPEAWVSKISAYLQGKINEDELLAAARITPYDTGAPDDEEKVTGDGWQQCEAWFFAGIKTLVSGDTAGAVARFQKCVATDKTENYCYQFATSELQALGK